ncbi:MAG: HAMP domain-containing protein [Spirochaetaceae bacterium]|nr:MAG: HAMP domain-containing protein [Spirochaetaceae bacterium]
MRRSLLYQIYPVYLIAILLVVGSLTYAATRVFRTAFYAEKETELHNSAALIANALGSQPFDPLPADSDAPAAEHVLAEFVHNLPLRVTLVDSAGTVLADSHIDAQHAENHAGRPEIVAAMAQGAGTDRRVSGSTGEKSIYVAVAVYDSAGHQSGVVRVAGSVSAIDQRTNEAFSAIILSALLILAATAGLTLIIVKRIHRPLLSIQQGALRYAAGDLAYRIQLRAPQEISAIADTLNSMADQLSDTIGSITAQRNELEAILSAMVEGVVVVDQRRRITAINRAAGELFRIDYRNVKGRSIIEALRNAEIDQIAEQTLQSGTRQEAGIVIYNNGMTHVSVHATTLHNENSPGVLLVLNDTTKMKQLESIRRDFVANVSHELRTPITSILGFVETLRDGALHDPQAAERFVEIIHSHSTRLNLIIEDLLSLSRLESYDAEVPLEWCQIDAIVEKAVQACEHDAERKSIQVQHTCAGAETVRVNAALLEQALVNLINNAVKYSPQGSDVEVTVNNTAELLQISVTDHGSGIPRRELARVFERFYRVDRARSRDMGGTGLGLAIVKHIALAHRGEVSVDSVEGRGSTFTLKLPQN